MHKMTWKTGIYVARSIALITRFSMWLQQFYYGMILSERDIPVSNQRLVSFGLIYSRARKLREQQDYDIQALAPEKKDVKTILEETKKFIDRIDAYLQQVGALD